MSTHFINQCKHGVVVSQCRCADRNKRVTIVACPLDCSEYQNWLEGDHAEGTAMRDETETVEIRPSNVDEMRTFAPKLLEEHWQEIAINKRVMRLNPNWKQYYELEVRGRLVMLAAWVGGEMVGYSVSMVYQHLHYLDLSILQNDVLFVTKAHRKSRVGLRLIEDTEQLARDRGCHMVLFHSKLDTKLCEILAARQYGVQDVIHSRVLE